MKACTKCGETKPLDDFPKLTRSKDGRRECCRLCHSAANAEYKRRDSAKETRKALYTKTKTRVLEQSRQWYAANKDRKAATEKAWREANRARSSRNARRYQLSRLRAMPPWGDAAKVEAIYAEAMALRELGIDAQVDHIFPLRGKLVSGLHWHGNLRIILAEDNRRKSNRMPDEAPCVSV
jgi:5-methylcytosine-specific restriction endonuclease McrA